MSLLRAFIAIEIPPEIHQAIEDETAPLRVALNASLMRWVPLDNIHLTLKFLGDVSPANVELLSQMLGVEVAQHQVFEMEFGGLGLTEGSPWGCTTPGRIAVLSLVSLRSLANER